VKIEQHPQKHPLAGKTGRVGKWGTIVHATELEGL
jgi:hypothetical protein